MRDEWEGEGEREWLLKHLSERIQKVDGMMALFTETDDEMRMANFDFWNSIFEFSIQIEGEGLQRCE